MHSRKQNSIAEQQVLLAPGHQTPSLSVMYAEFCRVCGAHSQRRPALALRCCGAPREREHQCALCRDCAARTPLCQGNTRQKNSFLRRSTAGAPAVEKVTTHEHKLNGKNASPGTHRARGPGPAVGCVGRLMGSEKRMAWRMPSGRRAAVVVLVLLAAARPACVQAAGQANATNATAATTIASGTTAAASSSATAGSTTAALAHTTTPGQVGASTSAAAGTTPAPTTPGQVGASTSAAAGATPTPTTLAPTTPAPTTNAPSTPAPTTPTAPLATAPPTTTPVQATPCSPSALNASNASSVANSSAAVADCLYVATSAPFHTPTTASPQALVTTPAPSIAAPAAAATCGDGLRSGGEACDDGNMLSDDGCSGSCAVEAGFVCKPSATGGRDVCTASTVPPAGSVFISASIRLDAAMTAEQFVGPVRRSFRQTIAESTKPELSTDKVLILSVRADQARRAGVLAVGFRMEALEAHMQTVAQSLSDAVKSGTLTNRLQKAGLDVTVKDMSEPAFSKSDGSSGTLQVSPNAEPKRNWIFVVVVAGVGAGVCVLCCCLYSHKICAGKLRKNKVCL